MGKIRIAIAGIGNCASALIQGIEYYRNRQKDDCIGLMHWDLGGYKPFDIEVVAAFGSHDLEPLDGRSERCIVVLGTG